MMRAVASLAQRMGVPAQVSLETPMACGVGICFSRSQKFTTSREEGTIVARVRGAGL